MSAVNWEHIRASFVIRLSRAACATDRGEGARHSWIGRIEHVQSGQRATLHELEDLVGFIRARLEPELPRGLPSDHAPGEHPESGPSRRWRPPEPDEPSRSAPPKSHRT